MSSMLRDISKASKRKKRKTRKCLNEIRNRSMKWMYNDQSLHGENHIANKREVPSLVTTKRLTLNGFPKSIRSETITRPALEEIKRQAEFFTTNDRILTPNLEVNCIELSDTADNNNSLPLFDQAEDINIHYNPCSSSPKLTHLTLQTDHSSPSGSQTSNGNYNELYTDLMLKISSHIKKLSTNLIKEDVLKITKKNMKKLLLKSFSSGNISTNINNKNIGRNSSEKLQSPEDNIVQDPLSYIRQAQELVDCNDLSETSSPLSSPEGAPIPQDFAGVCTHDLLYNTPQYNFYPHKLN